MISTPPSVLLVGASSPSSRTGLEVDQRVLSVLGCYAMTATTALTVQNMHSMQDVHVTSPEFLRKQLLSAFEDVKIDVVKIGMLASVESIEVVAEELGK